MQINAHLTYIIHSINLTSTNSQMNITVDAQLKWYLSPQYISSVFKMASTWRYTLVCLDGVMDISTTD